jgi:hypothetical protein
MAFNKKQRKELEEYFITHSQESNRVIAKKFNLTHPTVKKYRDEFYSVIKSEFIQESVKQSIFEIRRSVIHWKDLINKLYEELNTNQKTIVMIADGKKVQSVIPLEPMERVKIIHEISDLEVKIQEWGNDPEIAQILKAMDTGKIQ